MQNRLYYTDSEITEFEATVESQIEIDGKYHITLSQTAFYPTSGGQPHDVGTIGPARVLDVTVEDTDSPVVHVVDGPVPIGESVHCIVDFERRFDHMQQHLAQHILSAVFEQEMDVDTIGFHLGAEAVNIDLATKQLSPEAVQTIEERANQVITENRSVLPRFVDASDLDSIPLRHPPKVERNIRVVVIDGFDYNACGGTHPKSTAQVGILKIIRVENTPRGVRVHFVAGKRALHDYRNRVDVLQELSTKFSTTVFELPQSVERLQETITQLRKAERELKESLASFRAQEVVAQTLSVVHGVNVLVASFPAMDTHDLKTLAKYAKQVIGHVDSIICFHSLSNDRVNVLVECLHTHVNANQFLQSLLNELGGKGGGNANAAQGSAPHQPNIDFDLSIRSKLELFISTESTL